MTNVYIFLLSSILTLGVTIADLAEEEALTITAASKTASTVKLEEDATTLLRKTTTSTLPSSTVEAESTTLKLPISSEAAPKKANETTTVEGDDIPDNTWTYENTTIVDSRRILYSKTTKPGARPYMVYLQLTKESAKAHKYRGWLCGGVIVDRYYILTSAACVEDADRFYIISGTTKYVDSADYKSNDCVCKHRRRAVWKCIPKNYKFDFQDSVKWSSNDVAVVKVDRPFKFGGCEKGCEFPADLICYNNKSRDLEKPGTKGYIAGWGSGSNFREGVYRRQEPHIPENAKCLQEAKVCVMDNEQCAKKWAQRFRNIITQYMICTKDVMKRISDVCDKKYANCTDVEVNRRRNEDESPNELSVLNVDLGRHLRDPDDYTARRSSLQGGFCENDHGGPLIVIHENVERVVGIISACKIDPKSHSCQGPFLYTSVFRNRQFISCAIHKDVEENCRRVFRSGITHEEWEVSWDDYKEEDDDKLDKPASKDKPTLRQSEDRRIMRKRTYFYKAEDKEEASEEKKENKTTTKKHQSKQESKSNESKKSKEVSVEKPDMDKQEFFYESSQDEAVNEPQE